MTGLYFGSFNPIHNGHLMLANYLLAYGGLDEVWFVVSPKNPLKEDTSLLLDTERLKMVKLAIKGFPQFKASDIEFAMPRPSYTIDTLKELSKMYPKIEFTIICGMDSLHDFHKWKDYDELIKHYILLVYPRKGYTAGKWEKHPAFQLLDAPEIQVSSSFIRKAISEGKEIPFFMPAKAYTYMIKMGFYR